MRDDLAAYLDSLGSNLLGALDAEGDLAVGTAEHLYRYAVALLQGLILPEHVAEEWADFFCLADAFVLAYGSRRLGHLTRKATLLSIGKGGAPLPLTGPDRSALVDLVRELGEYVVADRSVEPLRVAY
jgi:hypothetical protein